MQLTHLWRYPLKSGAAEALETVTLGEEGLAQDRRFVVVAARGKFVTARTHPEMQRLALREDASGQWRLWHLDRPNAAASALLPMTRPSVSTSRYGPIGSLP